MIFIKRYDFFRNFFQLSHYELYFFSNAILIFHIFLNVLLIQIEQVIFTGTKMKKKLHKRA